MNSRNEEEFVWVLGEHGCMKILLKGFNSKMSRLVEDTKLTYYEENQGRFVEKGNGVIVWEEEKLSDDGGLKH